MIANKILWLDAITFMTVHSSKALNFQAKCLWLGMGGSISISDDDAESGDLKEERRLFYVRDHSCHETSCIFTYALGPDTIWTGFWIVGASRFLEEVEANCIQSQQTVWAPRYAVEAFRKRGDFLEVGIRWYSKKRTRSIKSGQGRVKLHNGRVLTLRPSNTNNLQAQATRGASEILVLRKVQNWNRRN